MLGIVSSKLGYPFTKLYNFINEKDVNFVSKDDFNLTLPTYSWRVVEFK
jgi:hypothetical protein